MHAEWFPAGVKERWGKIVWGRNPNFSAGYRHCYTSQVFFGDSMQLRLMLNWDSLDPFLKGQPLQSSLGVVTITRECGSFHIKRSTDQNWTHQCRIDLYFVLCWAAFPLQKQEQDQNQL